MVVIIVALIAYYYIALLYASIFIFQCCAEKLCFELDDI